MEILKGRSNLSKQLLFIHSISDQREMPVCALDAVNLLHHLPDLPDFPVRLYKQFELIFECFNADWIVLRRLAGESMHYVTCVDF